MPDNGADATTLLPPVELMTNWEDTPLSVFNGMFEGDLE